MPETFNAPPKDIDCSRNISQWIQYTSEHSPKHPLFAYAFSGSEMNHLNWSQFGAAVERAACLVDSYFNVAITAEGKLTPPVVGILANLDSIKFHTLWKGILRAGGTAFLISNRNSPAAVSYLLKQTDTHKLLVSTEEQTQTLVSSALALEDHAVAVHTAPTFQTLFENHDTHCPFPGGLNAHIDAPAVILHSSGSTSFPKPLSMTHRTIVQWARLTELVGVKLHNDRLAVHALPVYHSMGFFAFYWALRVGWTLTVFPPQSPPVIPSPANFLSSIVASKSSFVYCVPLFLEIWSSDAEATAHLKNLRGIVFGGGPFNPAVGNELVHLGVPLIGLYGSTEVGPGCLLVAREPGDKEWEWLQLSPFTNAKFLPQEDPNTFELVYVECPTHSPLVFNTTVDGNGAFGTSDIVIRHPTDPKKFKIRGRKDDQIMLSSGEKTNPGPIEAIICRNPMVEAALMFGRGRDQNGIIIQPSKGHEFDPTNASELARFRNDIWPSIAQANQGAPSHSRIFKEMILVTYPSKPVEMTAKYTPRREATLDAYKGEIIAAYDAVQVSTQLDIPLPMIWDPTDVLAYVRKVVHKVVDKQVTDETDIFEQGCDSLQATYIRNCLVRAVRQNRRTAAGHISQNFVYDNATIVRLAGRLLMIVNATPGFLSDKVSHKLEEIETAISEFSTQFPDHRPRNWQEIFLGEVVLLTGTTGGLGSQLLSNLVASTEVSHVYALNRRSKDGRKSLRNRQSNALSQRGLDVGIINSPKVTLVEGDTAARGLDIDPNLYSEIRDRITLIIHNAWKVNFNLAFRSFKDNVKGVRTLIDLALESPRQDPPRIIYASSVGVFRHWDAEQGMPLEAPIKDPKLALGNGYGESKFVGERILENAAKCTPLRPIIVRIGQMTGTSNGAWNSGDWLPTIVRSGQVLGVLPARSDCIAWISLETAAQAMFEFRHSESQHLHLAHPNPAQWNSVFEVFASRLNVPLVSWSEWLEMLEKSAGGRARNPAVYLIGFFRGCAPMSLRNREAPGIPLMDLTQALKSSRSLGHPSLPQIGRQDAEGWISRWKAVGFLSNDVGKL